MIDYKLATYGAVQGPRAGIVVGEEVFDLAGLTDKPSYATVLDVLKDWETAQTLLDKAAEETSVGKINKMEIRKACSESSEEGKKSGEGQARYKS